jgi:predicted DNA-binding protein with PD1-like motif
MEIKGRHKAKEIMSLRVDPGECLLGTIESAVKEAGGNAIVLTAVGSLSKCREPEQGRGLQSPIPG